MLSLVAVLMTEVKLNGNDSGPSQGHPLDENDIHATLN
jgi:hypothetical protein